MSESASPNGGSTKRPRARKSPAKSSSTTESAAPESMSAAQKPAAPRSRKPKAASPPQDRVEPSATSRASIPEAVQTPPVVAGAEKTRSEPASDRGAEARAGEAIEVIRVTAFDRRSMIATAAYYRAERRQFASGHELEDWLAAEADVDALLRGQNEVAGREGRSA